MSDLVDKGAAAVGRLVESRTEDLVAKGIAKAKDAIDDRRALVALELDAYALAGAEPPGERLLEAKGLELAASIMPDVEGSADAIAEFAKDKARAILIHVSSGNEGNARRLAAASTMTFAERRAASAASTSDVLAAAERRRVAVEKLIALGKKAGEGLLRALPYILAVL